MTRLDVFFSFMYLFYLFSRTLALSGGTWFAKTQRAAWLSVGA